MSLGPTVGPQTKHITQQPICYGRSDACAYVRLPLLSRLQITSCVLQDCAAEPAPKVQQHCLACKLSSCLPKCVSMPQLSLPVIYRKSGTSGTAIQAGTKPSWDRTLGRSDPGTNPPNTPGALSPGTAAPSGQMLSRLDPTKTGAQTAVQGTYTCTLMLSVHSMTDQPVMAGMQTGLLAQGHRQTKQGMTVLRGGLAAGLIWVPHQPG